MGMTILMKTKALSLFGESALDCPGIGFFNRMETFTTREVPHLLTGKENEAVP